MGIVPQADREEADPTYDPLDNKWMFAIWFVSALFWAVIIFGVWLYAH